MIILYRYPPVSSPIPMKIPDRPISPLAAEPKCLFCAIQVPYTPLINVSSNPERNFEYNITLKSLLNSF